MKYNSDFNIYDRIPRSLIPPAVILKPRPHRSVLYPRAQSSPFAEWHWILQVIVGQVDDQTAQDQVGAMISPGSELIRALEDAKVARGFVQVVDGAMSEMMVDQVSLYVHAELSIYVKA
jgi:hypothetical protein